jgi:hypothetical protein
MMRWVSVLESQGLASRASARQRAFCALRLAALLVSLAPFVSCADPPLDPRTAKGGGRVLMAPGVGLAGAKVHVERLDRFGLNGHKPGDVSASLGVITTDADGYFLPTHDQTLAGIHVFRVTGGTYRDPISGELIQRSSRDELRSLYRFGFFEDNSTGILVTPVHTLIEARFRGRLAVYLDPLDAYVNAYEHMNAHFGDLDWLTVVPADVSQPAISPTEEVRAAFVLGGLAVLADNMRAASDASPQAVTLTTMLDALREDLADPLFDGNDDNALTQGGLAVGECPPPLAGCMAQPGTCPLGACRPSCDLYVNTARSALAQAIAAFIGTRAFPSKWNKTGIGAEDARGFLDDIGRNPDPELFGDQCVDTIDRSPPSIGWTAPADDIVFTKGEVVVSFVASDDSGDGSRAYFPGREDEDGDLTNNVARFTLRTRELADGPTEVIAAAIDKSGNLREVRRTLEIDNTAPAIALDASPFLADARAWWTATSTLTLRGTVTELHPKALAVTVGAQSVAATQSGASWSVDLTDGMISSAGTVVTVRAEDLAGNVTTQTQTLRLDTAAPTFAVNSTTVKDERGDTIGFIGVTPNHTHSGPAVALGDAGCPDVYKYAYLLDENMPLFGGETGARNPLAWSFQLADDGVGLDPARTQYRVRAGGATVLDWTDAPSTDAGGGSRRSDLTLYRNGAVSIPALGTYEGPIEIDFRGQDRFAHEVSGTRCWTHHPLAAPVFVGDAYTPGVGGHPAHALSLNAHGLEATRTQDLATLLLNDTTTGASTMDAEIVNGTAEIVYLTIQLTTPTTVTFDKAFEVVHNATSVVDVNPPEACGPTPCPAVPGPEAIDPPSVSVQGTPFELRLYRTDANGLPTTQVAPCAETGCVNTTTIRTYKLDARTATALPRYLAMTWLTKASDLRPSNGTRPATPPFYEFTQVGRQYTGQQTVVAFCSRIVQIGIPRMPYCAEMTTYQRRQNLTSASIRVDRTLYQVRAAASPQVTPMPTSRPGTSVNSTPYDTAE